MIELEVRVRLITLVRKVLLRKHMINCAVSTTIMDTSRYANVHTMEAWY